MCNFLEKIRKAKANVSLALAQEASISVLAL